MNFPVAGFVDEENPALAISNVDVRFKFIVGVALKALFVYLYS